MFTQWIFTFTFSEVLSRFVVGFSLTYIERAKRKAIIFSLIVFYSLNFPQCNSNHANSKKLVIHISLLTSLIIMNFSH